MSTTFPTLTLGWRLRMAIEHAGVSVQRMADELGVTRQTISRWMHDEGAPPKAAYVKQWALMTQTAYSWLATGTGPDSDSDLGGSTSGWKRATDVELPLMTWADGLSEAV